MNLCECFARAMRQLLIAIATCLGCSTLHSSMTDALRALNAKYALQEASDPREGYRVVVQDHPDLRARLIPMGARRETVQLSGVPQSNDRCPFCTTTLKVLKTYEDCS